MEHSNTVDSTENIERYKIFTNLDNRNDSCTWMTF